MTGETKTLPLSLSPPHLSVSLPLFFLRLEYSPEWLVKRTSYHIVALLRARETAYILYINRIPRVVLFESLCFLEERGREREGERGRERAMGGVAREMSAPSARENRAGAGRRVRMPSRSGWWRRRTTAVRAAAADAVEHSGAGNGGEGADDGDFAASVTGHGEAMIQSILEEISKEVGLVRVCPGTQFSQL